MPSARLGADWDPLGLDRGLGSAFDLGLGLGLGFCLGSVFAVVLALGLGSGLGLDSAVFAASS